MELTNRETWAALHGIILGGAFLLAFAGGLAGLWSLRPEWVTVSSSSATRRSWRRSGRGAERPQSYISVVGTRIPIRAKEH